MDELASLPSGRHGLSREQVVSSQRARMLKATADVMKEHGYAGTSVAEIIRCAGVSRETFYQQFRSKQDCFVQALDAATRQLTELLSVARPPGPGPDRTASDPAETFRRLLRRYLHTLAEQPAVARLFLVEVHAAGPEAMARRGEGQRRFAEAIAEIFPAGAGAGAGAGADPGPGPEDKDKDQDERRFNSEALVAAIAHLVTARLVADDLDGLRALEDPLVRLATRLLS
ncbi:TetR/AcrR family transcriptional regulator [Streptomyces sp. NBC_01304]|uniref:TetR/AcrR family transcriptional regulator n=1 Tax=Streptomyces sp. NBC_01304 TaxID=2903818 RepID=UPI002E0D6D36|nr:TetR/AcrR family transcriptional regulator [Streptomyces sp. NBC_01304]